MADKILLRVGGLLLLMASVLFYSLGKYQVDSADRYKFLYILSGLSFSYGLVSVQKSSE